ncbi:hypothetical protein BC834DRAFT_203242 [Gloeopeniophorella convolvens]|nr:hypothetical protein BC834DRAFT_203242 [Gloeopeniophorella convolvens]
MCSRRSMPRSCTPSHIVPLRVCSPSTPGSRPWLRTSSSPAGKAKRRSPSRIFLPPRTAINLEMLCIPPASVRMPFPPPLPTDKHTPRCGTSASLYTSSCARMPAIRSTLPSLQVPPRCSTSASPMRRSLGVL